MRRVSLLLAIMVTALVAITGVALADAIDCFPDRACIGTNGPDTLNGTSSFDDMDARQGNDVLYGHERYDFMTGDAYEARDTSTDGNDRVGGGQSGDEMFGYGGDDKLLGRSGGDFIFAEESSENEGEDVVKGNEGNDWILARDGEADTIGCGTGRYDTVFFDQGGIDTVSNSCERKRGGVYSATSASSGTTEEVSAKELEALRAR
jgi:Ca2+-binding RTX toxin-like protein